MRGLGALLFCLLVAGCASAPPPPPVAVDVPAIAWQPAGTVNYESRYPGMGTSHRYTSPAGWSDVYIYTLGRNDWQPGVRDPGFADHFASTIEEVREYAARGEYADLRIGATHDVTVADQPFRMVGYDYRHRGKAIHSVTYLTALHGRLLKYRISIFADPRLDPEAVARQFVEENLRSAPAAQQAGFGTALRTSV